MCGTWCYWTDESGHLVIDPKSPPRFIKVDAEKIGQVASPDVQWWLDKAQPLSRVNRSGYPLPLYRYLNLDLPIGKDPNDFVPVVGDMKIIACEVLEFAFVCLCCFESNPSRQYDGVSKFKNGMSPEKCRGYHQRVNGWCHVCDPIFGNGGLK